MEVILFTHQFGIVYFFVFLFHFEKNTRVFVLVARTDKRLENDDKHTDSNAQFLRNYDGEQRLTDFIQQNTRNGNSFPKPIYWNRILDQIGFSF